MNESESRAAEGDRKRKEPRALQQLFSVKDKAISTSPSGTSNTHSISYSQTHRSVLLPVSKAETRSLPVAINLPSVINEPQSRIIFIKLYICDSPAESSIRK